MSEVCKSGILQAKSYIKSAIPLFKTNLITVIQKKNSFPLILYGNSFFGVCFPLFFLVFYITKFSYQVILSDYMVRKN